MRADVSCHMTCFGGTVNHLRPPPPHLESAENRSHPLLQAVPPLVPLVDHDFELAGGIGPVLPGQAAVLFVDQLQLSQTLVDLPLERLHRQRDVGRRHVTTR